MEGPVGICVSRKRDNIKRKVKEETQEADKKRAPSRLPEFIESGSPARKTD